MLSTSSEYALRALVALASTVAGTTVQARELAHVAKVPSSYLYKILAPLRRAGILDGARGTGGGYSLARKPEEIPLIEVVALFEVVRPDNACLLGNDTCTDKDACSAHEEWKRVRDSYLTFLRSRTIADLTASPGEVRRG
jgi:Rrf2 family protein